MPYESLEYLEQDLENNINLICRVTDFFNVFKECFIKKGFQGHQKRENTVL
ncbi:hypothetical protein MIDIC_490037 [Alphaproteobacteria bacterium]